MAEQWPNTMEEQVWSKRRQFAADVNYTISPFFLPGIRVFTLGCLFSVLAILWFSEWSLISALDFVMVGVFLWVLVVHIQNRKQNKEEKFFGSVRFLSALAAVYFLSLLLSAASLYFIPKSSYLLNLGAKAFLRKYLISIRKLMIDLRSSFSPIHLNRHSS